MYTYKVRLPSGNTHSALLAVQIQQPMLLCLQSDFATVAPSPGVFLKILQCSMSQSYVWHYLTFHKRLPSAWVKGTDLRHKSSSIHLFYREKQNGNKRKSG